MILPVAHAAIGELFGVNIVLLHEFVTEGGLVGRRPVQVKNLLARTNELLRRAMTFETPFHVERVRLPGERHLIELPMTRRTTDAVVHMDAVIEKNKIRRVIDARPAQRSSRSEAFSNRREQWRVFPDLRVASHADFSGGHSGKRRFLDRRVTEPAIESEAIDMMLVAERHGLFERNGFARRPRRPINGVQNPAGASDEKNHDGDTGAREGIGSTMENLRHKFSTPANRNTRFLGHHLYQCVGIHASELLVICKLS